MGKVIFKFPVQFSVEETFNFLHFRKICLCLLENVVFNKYVKLLVDPLLLFQMFLKIVIKIDFHLILKEKIFLLNWEF